MTEQSPNAPVSSEESFATEIRLVTADNARCVAPNRLTSTLLQGKLRARGQWRRFQWPP